MSKRFAIVDLETTGGRADRERIIEIAIAIHDGTQIVNRFESLIHPEKSIPYNITRITGISTDMILDAPKFFEVAKKVVEITEDTIIVAHNARFDYAFLVEEFKRLGYTYTKKKLCTVKMSRKAFPKLEGGHSLGNLIKQFGIKVNDRHRAMADVLATVEVFDRIIRLNNGNTDFDDLLKNGLKETILPEGVHLEDLKAIPNKIGVYYLHDEHGNVVYVGKSIHIKKRIFEHFRDQSRKGDLIQRLVRSVSYECTGSELIALIVESHEIRRLQPIINKAQRGKAKLTGILSYENQFGYIRFRITTLTASNRNHHAIIAKYEKPSMAKLALFKAKSTFDLCDCLTTEQKEKPSCLYHQIGQCEGAGIKSEDKKCYNERATAAKNQLSAAYDEDCLIIEQGREDNEAAVLLIENGKFQGFGYFNRDESQTTVESLKLHIEPYLTNTNIPGIIRTYLTTNKQIKVIPLNTSN